MKKAQLELGFDLFHPSLTLYIEREKELARLKKEEEAKRLERLWQENQRNLIQKQKDREKKNELDRYSPSPLKPFILSLVSLQEICQRIG